jgi:glyceraldehyde 3-phosphate dehydrogenase
LLRVHFDVSLPIAINGVGRVGRALIRRLSEHPSLELVALNDLASAEQLAALLTRDTFHGPSPVPVAAAAGALVIAGRTVPLTHERDPRTIPWGDAGARLVIEATGTLTANRSAEAHLGSTVERVILSSNSADTDLTVCMGVNQDELRAQHKLLSAASCTTNCLAVAATALKREFSIRRALLNTVHCYNNNQSLVDAPHADPRRARAATVNMIPTTTGASSAIGRVMPELGEKLDGFAVRVPAAQVSLIDLVVDLEGAADVSAVNDAFRRAAKGDLASVLAINEEPLVSTDFIGDPHSAIVDLSLTQTAGGGLFRVVCWYDNEAGYAARLGDLAEHLDSLST